MAHLVRMDPSGEPTRIALNGPTALIGRGSDCDIRLDDVSVSRRHARLTTTVDGWSVDDLESTNWTYVNHVCVGRSALRDADVLTIGKVVLRFQAGSITGPSSPGSADPEGSAAATVRIVRA
jgi:two-component system cell cycle response regulator